MRPILNVKPKVQSAQLDLSTKSKVATKLAGAHLEARVKRKRGLDYVRELTKLDAGTHIANRGGLTQVVAAIESEFEDLEIAQRPLGFVQKCILGPEFEVHILDLSGTEIVRHFKIGEAMPAPFERARSLALHPGRRLLNTYAFVEIYTDRVVAVYADGPVTYIDPTSL
jgi:hypothetical protein